MDNLLNLSPELLKYPSCTKSLKVVGIEKTDEDISDATLADLAKSLPAGLEVFELKWIKQKLRASFGYDKLEQAVFENHSLLRCVIGNNSFEDVMQRNKASQEKGRFKKVKALGKNHEIDRDSPPRKLAKRD